MSLEFVLEIAARRENSQTPIQFTQPHNQRYKKQVCTQQLLRCLALRRNR